MIRDIDDIEPLRVMPKTIDASCYNHVRLALIRISNPLRLELPDHRGLEIILSNTHWYCIDSLREDLPIMTWCEFDTRQHNTALHEPVTCQLRLYHMHAGLVMGTALISLEQKLQEILHSRHEP